MLPRYLLILNRFNIVVTCSSLYCSRNLFDVELLEGYANGKPEIAMPSPFASASLNTTGASQIRTDKGIMNRSKGRGADWEVNDLQEAQKVMDMPDTMARIEEKIDRIEKNSIYSSSFYSDLAGNSHLGFF